PRHRDSLSASRAGVHLVWKAYDIRKQRELFIEHFVWKDGRSSDVAHQTPEVMAVWEWPTTTRHLRVLEDAGLIKHQKQGRRRVYTVDRSRLALVSEWLQWFESPAP